ncbi:MAG: rhodanese-like domain-containing protein [Bacteroidetes bacterium]|nr:rhodanese-like domain-containing protein [Bacteroidota bacterium]MBK9800084.1 rhodanese-like domain-containing protein [Bacteroidota bacterium]MBP6413855.1 rhodanese-like domain-containing protein [Bacteroidia bacterium]
MKKQILVAAVAVLILAGNVAAQEIEKNDIPKFSGFSASVFKDKYKNTNMLLDVRDASLFAKGHIKGALNITIDSAELPAKLKNIKREENVYLYSDSIATAAQAANILAAAGFKNVYILEGEYSELLKLGMLEVK